MLESKKICTICARGGSKGVPGKNLRLLDKKPLIAHTIELALGCKLFDEVAVSSDSDEILDVSAQFGIKSLIKRPDEMSRNTSAKLPVIRHCVEEVENKTGNQFDICVDLDCTSPLRTKEDIENCINMLIDKDCPNVITGVKSKKSPYFNMVELDNDDNVRLSKALPNEITRRQDAPSTYDMNASIYVWKRNVLMTQEKLFLERTKIYIMPEIRSIDIDSEIDFKLVEYALNELKKAKK